MGKWRAVMPKVWWLPWAAILVLLTLALPLTSQAQADGLFFVATGHTLSDEQGFLSYWRSHNGETLLGLPVTEVLEEGGRAVQYFERGRIELHSDLEGEPLMLGLIGSEYARAAGKSFPDGVPSAQAGTPFFSLTKHSLGEPFLSFWQQQGGLAQFGYPISDPRWEFDQGGQYLVQYFERARLEHHPAQAGTPYEVQIGLLGRSLAELYGYPTAPVANPGLPVYGAQQLTPSSAGDFAALAVPAEPQALAAAPVQEAAAVAEPVQELAAEAVAPVLEVAPVQEIAPAPAAAAVPEAAPAPAVLVGGKSIVVSIGDQWLYAYENGVQVFSAPISTGRDGFNTPVGNFSVYAKTPSQTMSGVIGGEAYNVPNVPSVMYINGGVALHGTYWHNMFGSGVRMSHGCINLPLDSAAWLYDWAPTGTPVSVVY